MKRGIKSLLVLAVFGLFGILLVGGVSGACSDNQRIMRLYQTSNSHGAIWNDANGYNIEICFNEIFGTSYTGGNYHTCSGSNNVLWLSANYNSHASTIQSSTYNTPVCYGNLECTARASSCQSGEQVVVSLYSSSNSHVAEGDFAGYNTKICCKEGPYCGDGTCDIGEDCSLCSDCACSGSTPFCSGSGNCVECLNANDCNDNDVCTIDSCSGGVCQYSFITCDDGKECTQDVLNCPFVGCEFQNLPQGTSCSIGYCDGLGTCVECTQDSHCPADYWLDEYQCSGNQPQRKKRDYYCSGNSCTYQDIWQNYGSVCSGATPYCAGSGDCVECTLSSHCDDGIICTTDSCSSGICANTPNSALCESWEECIIGVGCTQTECAGCEDCDGWFSGCDYIKCHNECQISEACYYRGVVAGENCVGLNYACNNLVSLCEDYSDQECVDDPCNVAPVGGNGCELDGGNCVEAAYCGNEVCDAGEDCSLCSDCACSGSTPFCSLGECVECLSDSDCLVLGEYCNPITNQCTVPQQCEDCGGWLGFGCDEQECHDIGECYFDDNAFPFPNDCIDLDEVCLVIENCEDYSVEECISNPCNIVGEGPGCGLNSDNECVEVPYCGEAGCDAFECLEINNLIECNDWTQHTGFEDEFLCAWKCSDGPCPPNKIINEGECNFCSTIPNTCSGYNNEETCEIDPCYKADWDCSFLDCNDSQNYYCWWDNENICKFNATIGEDIFCTYHAKIIEECEKFDTQRRILKYTGEPAENCPLKIVETPCANVVKLDFFNWINAIIVIIVLIVIYYVKGRGVLESKK